MNSIPVGTKFIFVTGGVLSGIGKGITAASIGATLKARGLNVNIQKCDPYLNVDAGTLKPGKHGECFVTADGAETDLDLGHYERFLDIDLNRNSSLMSGRILLEVINRERAGGYDGNDVQIIPHVTDSIMQNIVNNAVGYDVHIVEIGGTVGDYESLPFIEAIRELSRKVGKKNCLNIHVVYLPYLSTSGEYKTKPAQNAVRLLRSLGINTDILVTRSDKVPNIDLRSKLSLFCDVDESAICQLANLKSVYQVPLEIEKQGIGDYIAGHFDFNSKPDLKNWKKLQKAINTNFATTVNVAVVGKYMDNLDTYMSVIEALKSASWNCSTNISIKWVDSEKITSINDADKLLANCQGIVVPGGFGIRGTEGMILTAEYALKDKVPYLGLCLGMQMATVAFARVNGMLNANSTEFDPNTDCPVITTMDDQVGKELTGGTMRLGNYKCVIKSGTKTAQIYHTDEVYERHRHRYEFNNDYRKNLEGLGLIISGQSADGQLVEIIEIASHPFMIGTQFHPELRSRPFRPHPLFNEFIKTLKSLA